MSNSDPQTENAAVEQTSDALLLEVHAALKTLADLEPHGEQLGEPTVERMRDTVAEIRNRLTRDEIFVCVVGEQKAGKSTFLNAILGMPLLGTAVRECTGTVTYIRPASRPSYRARLQSGQWEEFGEKSPGKEDGLSAELRELDHKLEHCDQLEATCPDERDKLQQRLQQLQESLQTQTHESEQAERDAAQQETQLAQLRVDTETLGNRLKQAAAEVPWRYRRATGWLAAGHRVGRLLSRRPVEPQWEAHLAEAAHWEQQKKLVSQRAADLRSALKLVREKQLAVTQTQQEIDTTATQLAEVCQTLDALPAIRSEHQQARLAAEQSLREYCEQREDHFCDAVKQLTDMKHRGQEVQELHLFVPTNRLPEGMVLIDTPGVNTTTEENQQRAWNAIHAHADACLLVSDLAQSVSESTREFVRKIRQVTPHLLLVLSKRDAVLRNATLSGGDAESEVAEAISVGRSRFAAEVGRAEEELLTFAVAAQPALQETLASTHGGPASAAFQEELTRIFAVVEAERSLAITAKCASLLRKVHHDSATNISAAEQAYQQRIETLVQQRVEDPRALSNQRIAALVPQIRKTGAEISKLAREQLRAKLTEFRDQNVQQIAATRDIQRLAKAIKGFQDSLSPRLRQISTECRQQVDACFAPALADLVQQAREPILQRYRISQSVAATGPKQRMSVQVLLPVASLSLSTQTKDVQHKIKAHIKANTSLAMGISKLAGNATRASGSSGAAILAIGVGISVARAAMQARKFPGLRQASAAKVEEMLDQLIAQATSEETLGATAMEHQLGGQLVSIVRQDLHQFHRWIEAVIQRERQVLEKEQQQLAHLRSQIEKLHQQDARLLALLDQATTVCRGLCQQPTR